MLKQGIKVLFFLFLTVSSAQEWTTSIDNAKEIAAKEDKTVVLVFQGSDWCAPCIKLDREIWSASAFKEVAKDDFVMVKADFPRRKANKLSAEQQEQNNKLAEKYNPKGYFPYVVVLNSEGEVIGATGYEKISPDAYCNKLKAFL